MSTISVENVSVSVFQEGVTRKETARLSALRQGVRNENAGRLKRRLERDVSATSTKGKRPKLDVSDTPAKNVFKAVHGGSNMERVTPCGKPVEVKPVAASRQDVKSAESSRVQDPREEATATKHEAGNKVSEEVKTSAKKVEANPSVKERGKGGVKDGREVWLKSGSRAQQCSGGSVERKRPPPRSTSRSRSLREDRGRDHDHRDRDHGRDHDRDHDRNSRRSRHHRRERDEHDRRRSRSRSRSR